MWKIASWNFCGSYACPPPLDRGAVVAGGGGVTTRGGSASCTPRGGDPRIAASPLSVLSADAGVSSGRTSADVSLSCGAGRIPPCAPESSPDPADGMSDSNPFPSIVISHYIKIAEVMARKNRLRREGRAFLLADDLLGEPPIGFCAA